MTTAIPFSSIKVLSFDIYGTLIDWETGIYSCLLASPLSPHLPSTRHQTLSEFEVIEHEVQSQNPSLRQRDVSAECVRRYAKQLDTSWALSEADVEAAAEAFAESIGSWPAFEDTVDAIKRLGARFKLVPLSNIDRGSWEATLRGPLKGCRFDAVYTAEDIGSYKPDARNFEYLLEHVRGEFRCEKEELCHVAQSLYHDHAPIKELGVASVWVERKGTMGVMKGSEKEGGDAGTSADKYGYQLRVESLKQLADIIDEATG